MSAGQQDRGRFSSKRKMEAALRLLNGEDPDLLSRELGVTVATLSDWRSAFLAGGQPQSKGRQPEPRGRPRPGTLRGKITVPDRFFDPLPEEELKAWEGR